MNADLLIYKDKSPIKVCFLWIPLIFIIKAIHSPTDGPPKQAAAAVYDCEKGWRRNTCSTCFSAKSHANWLMPTHSITDPLSLKQPCCENTGHRNNFWINKSYTTVCSEWTNQSQHRFCDWFLAENMKTLISATATSKASKKNRRPNCPEWSFKRSVRMYNAASKPQMGPFSFPPALKRPRSGLSAFFVEVS